MNRIELVNKVRTDARDFSNSIFREQDIILYINEAIDRVKQVIKECKPMVHLISPNQSPIILPSEYHSLLATYSTSRCFAQDERYNQASNLMNEFEFKLEELRQDIQSGELILVDPNNVEIPIDYEPEYVDLESYWGTNHIDLPESVEDLE